MNAQPANTNPLNSVNRPSLYANAELASDGLMIHGGSILGELEHTQPWRKKLAALLFIFFAAAAAIGWWQAGRFNSRSDTALLKLASDPEVSKQASHKAGSATVSPLQTANSNSDEGNHNDDGVAMGAVANVITDATLTASPHELSPAIQQNADLTVPVRTGDAAVQSGEKMASLTTAQVHVATKAAMEKSVADSAPAMASAKMTTTAAAPAIATAKDAASASASEQAAVKSPAAAKVQRNTEHGVSIARKDAVKAKHNEKDGDVELIAALLNRVTSKADPVPEESARKAVTAAPPQRATAGEQKKNRKSANPRDGNVAKLPESFEAQLKRCSSLGFFDSELCRLRLCEGRWGRESACPEYSQVSAASP
jgi:hypothetical protein